MIGICPYCEKETSLTSVENVENFNVRGEIIPVMVKYLRCDECGGEFRDPKSRDDPLDEAYSEYRRRKNLVQPEEIKAFRRKYDLTQKELSDLLGIGIATLSRYENGALQDEAHDSILRLGMQPRNLKDLINKNKEQLGIEKRERILSIIKEETSENLIDTLLEQFDSQCLDNYTGSRKFDRNKLYQTIKYFCYPEGAIKTKLNKLLFYADFAYYKNYDLSITGCKYVHLAYGPVPDNFEMIYLSLSIKDPSFQGTEIIYPNYVGEEYVSEVQPDLAVFIPAEMKILSSVKERFQDFNAKMIVEYSHQEVAYLKTQEKEYISYHYAKMLRDF
jgi:putative zinc finger/helix-turn-helix YgiT family protein